MSGTTPTRRVRHDVRDQLAAMAFTLAASGALTLLVWIVGHGA